MQGAEYQMGIRTTSQACRIAGRSGCWVVPLELLMSLRAAGDRESEKKAGEVRTSDRISRAPKKKRWRVRTAGQMRFCDGRRRNRGFRHVGFQQRRRRKGIVGFVTLTPSWKWQAETEKGSLKMADFVTPAASGKKLEQGSWKWENGGPKHGKKVKMRKSMVYLLNSVKREFSDKKKKKKKKTKRSRSNAFARHFKAAEPSENPVGCGKIANERRNSSKLQAQYENPWKNSICKLEKTLEAFKLGKISVSNPKIWFIVGVGVGVAGVLILAERRRGRRGKSVASREDFGAFIERFELLPAPQLPPPAARHPLAGLTFAVKDTFDIKDYVTGLGNPDWTRTHEPAKRTAAAITRLLKNGATCVGKTVMDEFSFGITGENMHYGTPTNPESQTLIPGGSSSGSAVAVAAELVDFSLGTDTTGCIRIPASFCGILGFRPSHGVMPNVGVFANSQSLDTIGWLARDPSVLHRVGHILLQAPLVELRRTRRFIFADDCFQLSKVPTQKSTYVIARATENLSGYQVPKHINIGQYIASKVPSLKVFHEASTNMQQGISTMKALSHVMVLLQRYEFKSNHEEWFKTVKPKLTPDISVRVLAALNASHENIKLFYKARTEMRSALGSLLKDDGILVIPTVSDTPSVLASKKSSSAEFLDRTLALLSIATMSGCCQVSVPLGKHDDCPIAVSFIASHGADKFLLDTLLDMYPYLQEQVRIAANALPLPDTNGDMDAAELLKEKGNAAYKGKQWNKAVNYYTEAIKLNGSSTTYYSNRAAAYLELGCFQQAEADCSQAMLLDKKNVKAYLRRGTAREMLLCYKEAAQDFKHALVLEPQNKTALLAEKRLRKLAG